MNTHSHPLAIGTFVRVHKSVGVIVGLPDTDNVPEEHYAVWYGEVNESEVPLCKSVPVDYCIAILESEFYH